ncbi:mersacidin/lichenicidin family type 2 lantibiotic [Nostoc sp. C117]|uniref:mersacidin/lichenicidin family type 2 lantibiotic n=1 Tax=Nostoc sp. C117 TaxID=3349875 RepID=UPI00370DA206
MSNNDIIRAWKDEEYSNSLTKKQCSQLPENPAGIIELSNEEMDAVKGGKMNPTIRWYNTGACGCI